MLDKRISENYISGRGATCAHRNPLGAVQAGFFRLNINQQSSHQPADRQSGTGSGRCNLKKHRTHAFMGSLD